MIHLFFSERRLQQFGVVQLNYLYLFFGLVEDKEKGRCILVDFVDFSIGDLNVLFLVEILGRLRRKEIVEPIEVSLAFLVSHAVGNQRLRARWLRVEY